MLAVCESNYPHPFPSLHAYISSIARWSSARPDWLIRTGPNVARFEDGSSGKTADTQRACSGEKIGKPGLNPDPGRSRFFASVYLVKEVVVATYFRRFTNIWCGFCVATGTPALDCSGPLYPWTPYSRSCARILKVGVHIHLHLKLTANVYCLAIKPYF